MTRGEQSVMEQVIEAAANIPVSRKSRAKMEGLIRIMEDLQACRFASYQGDAKVLVHGEGARK